MNRHEENYESVLGALRMCRKHLNESRGSHVPAGDLEFLRQCASRFIGAFRDDILKDVERAQSELAPVLAQISNWSSGHWIHPRLAAVGAYLERFSKAVEDLNDNGMDVI